MRIYLSPIVMSLFVLLCQPVAYSQSATWVKVPGFKIAMKNWRFNGTSGISLVKLNERKAFSLLSTKRYVKVSRKDAFAFVGSDNHTTSESPYLVRCVYTRMSDSVMVYSSYKRMLWISCYTPVMQRVPLYNCAAIVWLRFKPKEMFATAAIHDYE